MTTADARKAQIIDAGLLIARDGGLSAVTLPRVAKAVGISHALVSHYFLSADAMRNAIAREAIKRRDASVILGMIATSHPMSDKIPADVRREALTRAFG